MRKPSNIKIYLFYLIGISTFLRCIMACIVELGGDEAYYWTFALFPKLSHLDQQPMIGWLIQLFTNNLSLNNIFSVRFVSILIGSINTWIIFVLGRRMKNELAGLYAAILYTTSIYCTINGVFITPDAPQSFFLLLSIYFLHDGFIIKYEDCSETRTLSSISLIMAGVFIGLALLSKSSSGLLWAGALIYIVFFDKRFLKNTLLYTSIIISLLIFSPIIYWNIKYNFIGFRYIDNISFAFIDNFSFFHIFKSILRQIIYNNPANIAIAVAAIFIFRQIPYLKDSQYKLLLSISLPFIFFGLLEIGFFPLIMLSGAYLATKYHYARVKLPQILRKSIITIVLITLLGLSQLYFGIIDLENKSSPETKIGNNDLTLDNYGWRKLSKEFKKLRDNDLSHGKISVYSSILSNNYLSASHYNYYLANPNNIHVKTIGSLDYTRKYAFTTQESGGFKIGESSYYIESSRDLVSGESIGRHYFKSVELVKVLYVKRMEKPVLRYKIYRFKELISLPPKDPISFPLIYR